MKQSDIDKVLSICRDIKNATEEGENTALKVGGVLEKLAGAVTPDETLSGLAQKDLSNVSATVLQDKTGAAEDHELTLYFATLNDNIGSSFSPAYVKILYGRKINYTAMFVGSDNYVHKVVIDEDGNLTKQYAYSLDDFATKQDIEKIKLGDLTSQGYKPTHVIDLGRYENGSFGIDDAWYWGDVQGAIYNYLDGKCNLLLKGASNYNEPRMYTIEGVERDGDTRFTIRFKTSATRVHVISIDEDAYTDEGERVVTQSYIDLGNSGSGTITSSKFSDTEYTEITNNH